MHLVFVTTTVLTIGPVSPSGGRVASRGADVLPFVVGFVGAMAAFAAFVVWLLRQD